MKCDFDQNPESVSFTSQLGTAAALMMQSSKYLYYPMACLRVWIQPPILLRQIRFFFDYKGLPVGYVTWAFLSKEVENRLIFDPKIVLHISEWNEGERLWIMDFNAPTGFARSILAYMRREMFEDFSEARSLRRHPDGAVRCVNIWRRETSDA